MNCSRKKKEAGLLKRRIVSRKKKKQDCLREESFPERKRSRIA